MGCINKYITFALILFAFEKFGAQGKRKEVKFKRICENYVMAMGKAAELALIRYVQRRQIPLGYENYKCTDTSRKFPKKTKSLEHLFRNVQFCLETSIAIGRLEECNKLNKNSNSSIDQLLVSLDKLSTSLIKVLGRMKGGKSKKVRMSNNPMTGIYKKTCVELDESCLLKSLQSCSHTLLKSKKSCSSFRQKTMCKRQRRKKRKSAQI